MRLITELRRRNVFRVAALYVVGGWLILQIGDLLFDLMGLPDFALRIVLGILLLGFPAALVLAWIYELTPEGVKRERDVDRSASTTRETGRKLNVAVLVAVVLALGALGLDRLLPAEPPAGASDAEAADAEPARDDSSAGLAASDDRTSIAVLPFADLSPEGDQAYFADGISEEILNLLAGIDALKVASRTSSFAFKGQNRNIRSIAEELGVRHILEGSVRKAGERVRITAQLIQAETDEHLWSETYDRDLTDIFAIQEELATAILGALDEALALGMDTAPIAVPERTENLDAYALYLEGRELFIRRTNFERAMEALEQAVALDPNFARAWAQLGAVYTVVESWGLTGRDYTRLADEAADRAIALDARIALAYAVKGNVRSVGGARPDWEAGFPFYDRAIELDPRNTSAIFWRGTNWIQLGYFDRAAVDIARCLEIDPAYQNCAKRDALLELLAGREDEAFRKYAAAEEAGNGALTSRFFPLLVRRGDRLAAFLALQRILGPRAEACSLSDMLDALAGLPLADDRAVRAMECANEVGMGEVTFGLGRYDALIPDRYGAQLWQPEFSTFMESEDFDRLAEELGALAYWRTHGPPPQCKQVGEDFECRMP